MQQHGMRPVSGLTEARPGDTSCLLNNAHMGWPLAVRCLRDQQHSKRAAGAGPDAAAVSLLYSIRAVQVLGRQAKVSMDAVVLAN
jgi:hypothetical protein